MTGMEHAIENAARVIQQTRDAGTVYDDAGEPLPAAETIAHALADAGLLAPHRGRPATTVYRAHSPTRSNAGTTFADYARAQSQAAVRNQFVDCDPNTDQAADWHVQTGHVQWETVADE